MFNNGAINAWYIFDYLFEYLIHYVFDYFFYTRLILSENLS